MSAKRTDMCSPNSLTRGAPPCCHVLALAWNFGWHCRALGAGCRVWLKFVRCRLQYMAKGLLEGVSSVEQRPISLEEAKGAREVFLTSTSLPVKGVTFWDNKPIATGEVLQHVVPPKLLSCPSQICPLPCTCLPFPNSECTLQLLKRSNAPRFRARSF